MFSSPIFRTVRKGDIWDIYEISNDPTVRRYSLSQKPISKEEHLNWFKKVDKSLFFVLELNGKVIGQIRFQKIGNNTFEVSISLHSNYRGKGLGKLLLRKGISELLKRFPKAKILAKIREENEVSKKLFTGFGFKFQTKSGGIEIYTYEGSKNTSV